MAKYQGLKFGNLGKFWLGANREQTPQEFNPVQQSGDIPSYFMKPENMMSYLNAFSPYDLYRRPSQFPAQIDYDTSAFNIRQPFNANPQFNNELQQAILMASQNPMNRFLSLRGMQQEIPNYSDLNQYLQRFIPQGIYQHESAHYQDPRLNPMANNYGYLMRAGLPGNIASREIPAMRAEDRYWDYMRNRQ